MGTTIILATTPFFRTQKVYFDGTRENFTFKINPSTLALGYIKASVPHIKNVVAIDSTPSLLSKKDLIDHIKFEALLNNDRQIILGLSVTSTLTIPLAFTIAKTIKSWANKENLTLFTVLGGVAVTLAKKEALIPPYIDYIVMGHGMEPFRKLADIIIFKKGDLSNIAGLGYKEPGGEIKINPPAFDKYGLENLPSPDRSFVLTQQLIRDNITNIKLDMITTLGCKFNCKFCVIPEFYGGAFYVEREADNIMVEVNDYIKLKSIKNNQKLILGIRDDNFLADPNHFVRLADRVKDENFKITFDVDTRPENIIKAEEILAKNRDCLEYISIGLEHPLDRVLKRWRKGQTQAQITRAVEILEKHNIPYQIYLIPCDRLSDIKELEEFCDAFFNKNLFPPDFWKRTCESREFGFYGGMNYHPYSVIYEEHKEKRYKRAIVRFMCLMHIFEPYAYCLKGIYNDAERFPDQNHREIINLKNRINEYVEKGIKGSLRIAKETKTIGALDKKVKSIRDNIQEEVDKIDCEAKETLLKLYARITEDESIDFEQRVWAFLESGDILYTRAKADQQVDLFLRALENYFEACNLTKENREVYQVTLKILKSVYDLNQGGKHDFYAGVKKRIEEEYKMDILELIVLLHEQAESLIPLAELLEDIDYAKAILISYIQRYQGYPGSIINTLKALNPGDLDWILFDLLVDNKKDLSKEILLERFRKMRSEDWMLKILSVVFKKEGRLDLANILNRIYERNLKEPGKKFI